MCIGIFLRMFSMGIVCSGYGDAADILCLFREPPCYAAGSDHTDMNDRVTFYSLHGRRYIPCSLEVDDFTIFLQIVELPQPIGSYREDIHTELLDVLYLLTDVIFHDHFVHESGSTYIVNSGDQGIYDI